MPRIIVVIGAGAYISSTDFKTPFNSWYKGVVGLSTALKIQEKGHNVTIVAETFPDDPKSIRYTSQWAVSKRVIIRIVPKFYLPTL